MKLTERIETLIRIGNNECLITQDEAAEAIRRTSLADMAPTLQNIGSEIEYLEWLRLKSTNYDSITKLAFINLIVDAIYREAEIYEILKMHESHMTGEQA